MALSSISAVIFTSTSITAASDNLLPFSLSISCPSRKPLTTHNNNVCTSTTKWRTNVSFFSTFLNNSKKDASLIKQELLEAIAPLDRGAEATSEDQQTVDLITRKLEAVNPTKAPLQSDLLNGKWELIYTTSESILQTKRPKILRSKVNYQAINADILRAQNMESWPFFNQVTADLTPVNAKKVAVKFDFFKIGGLIRVKAPDRALGALEITYLDEDLRTRNYEQEPVRCPWPKWLLIIRARLVRKDIMISVSLLTKTLEQFF